MPIQRETLEKFLRDFQREWRFILATFAASGAGYLGSAAAPVIVQALIDAGLDYQQAGDLGTIELMSLTVVSTVIAPYVPRLSHRKLAVGGTLLVIAGLIVSASSVGYGAMLIGRLVTGAGSGLAISGANAAIAARKDAERVFAIIWTMGGGITAALSMNLPDYVEGGNYPVGFGILVLLCLIGLPMMFWIPPRPATFASPGSTDLPPTDQVSEREQPESVFGPLVWMALIGIFVYSLAEQALWNFAYNIPYEAGIPPDLVEWILGLTTLMGLAGGGIAAIMGTRLGRILPLVVGSLVSAAGRWIYIASPGSEWLFAGGLLWGLGFYFVSPYQIGLLAAIDRRGRTAVAAGAAMNLGYAIGPTVGGRILQHLDHSALILVVVAATLASMALLLPSALRADRLSRDATEPVER